MKESYQTLADEKPLPSHIHATAGAHISMLVPELPALTQRQFNCLAYIFEFYSNKKYYPTQNEISLGMLCTNRQSAVPHIVALLKKSCITREGDQARNLRLTMLGLKVLDQHIEKLPENTQIVLKRFLNTELNIA